MTQKPQTKSGFSRRKFIKITGISSVASLVIPSTLLSASNAGNKNEALKFDEHYLPVLKKCDVLIVGGGFAGVTAALEFAKSGASVVLIDRRIYLGREITSTYRPWVNHADQTRAELPELVKSCLDPDYQQPFEHQSLFRFNKVKLTLEETLIEQGVEILYASYPIQLIEKENYVQGLVIGNKSGRQVILAKMVIDCTETASVARLSKIGFEKALPELSSFKRTLEFIQIKPLKYTSLSVPESLKIKDNTLHIQQGYLGVNHYYVDCNMDFPNPSFDVENTVEREKEAWNRSIAVSKYLYEKVPEFNEAFLATSSYSLDGIYSAQMLELKYNQLNAIPKSTFKLNSHGEIVSSAFATPYTNLWCINESARIPAPLINHLLTPTGACEIALPLCNYLVNNWDKLAIDELPKTSRLRASIKHKAGSIVKEQESPQKGRDYDYFEVKEHTLSILQEVDILVVGGGTSGATAAIAAAEGGKKTMVIDMNPGFGGTGTFGGVLDYWGHGNYRGFVARHIKKMDEIHQYIPNYSKKYIEWFKPFVTWNVQAKKYMLLSEIEKAGAQIIWNSIAIGSIMDGNKVIGVVMATPQGVYGVKSKIVIDATGDGDVAGFAGAPFVFGTSGDGIPLWYALCKTSPPGITETSFQNSIDVTNIHDYTRAVMVGLRSGSHMHDHYTYLAPRESRHILGDVVLTLTDHMKLREWDDVIHIAYSNCDVKGYHSSDWLRMGLIPPNYEIEVPYRTLLPKTLENILVVGKALSANHESLATIRMQPDLEMLGGVAALAAVFALETGKTPRQINISEFQKVLVKNDVLPETVIGRKISAKIYTEAELEGLIAQFNPEKSLHSYSDMEMGEIWKERIPLVEVCTAPAELAVPALQKALKNTSGKMAVRVAQAMAMFGSESAASILHNEIMAQLSSGFLPILDEPVKWCDSKKMPPDQAAIPFCGNLVYSLGMTRSELNIPVWNKIAEIFNPQKIEDFYTSKLGLFYYVDAIAYGSRLLGSADAIPALKKLHANQFLNHRSQKNGIDNHHVLERLALLELMLGRALARSASMEGYEILIDYLDDARAVLAGSANMALTKITNQDFGKSKSEWKNWFQANEGSIKPVALAERIDG